MKRPPQFWLLSTLGILWLFLLHSSEGVRATSLIFAKTTTTTTEAPTEEEAATAPAASSEISSDANQTATRPPLTGIPQIDYIWDPNLPRELNGYNLTDYPFYVSIPEDINFKCDGLHDGFYASVPHKCQVYHHCLFGTRFDFLCANFTAFDQKTFICHFVSEVDCVNSPKYWHRNDALYQEASTTTVSTTTVLAPVTPPPAIARRPAPAAGRRRRPFRRRRPQYDYYYDEEQEDYDTERDRERNRDEYYDDPRYLDGADPPRGRPHRKRPRPNRRPEYDEYEYEDERFDRRVSGRRDEDRRPYDRRPSKKDPRRDEEDEERTDRRRPQDKPKDDRRRPPEDDYDRRPLRKPSRRPAVEEEEDRRYDSRRKDEDDRRYRPKDDKTDDRRAFDRPRKTDEDGSRRYRPKDDKPLEEDSNRRYRPKDKTAEKDDKSSEEDRIPRPNTNKPSEENNRRYRPKDKLPERDDTSYDEENRRYRPKDNEDSRRYRPNDKPDDASKVLVRPSSGSSIYDRPRAPPIIKRPVPVNERDKYDYKPAASSKTKPVLDEEYYDEEYEDEPPKSSTIPPKTTRKPDPESIETDRRGYRPKRPQGSDRRPVELNSEVPRRGPPKRPSERNRYETERSNSGNKKQKVVDDASYEEEEEYEEIVKPLRSNNNNKFGPRDRTSSEAPKIDTNSKESTRSEPVVRVVKRPFLPSRGGSPYTARGLLPVGAKALDNKSEEPAESQENISRQKSVQQEKDELEDIKSKTENVEISTEDIIKPITTRPRGQDFRQNFRSESIRNTAEIKPTPKPKTENYQNPLDINENEYDVTLNDALNPTLPNLPIRSVPTGFGSGRDGYNYQRTRYIAIETPLTSASSDYIYQIKEPQGKTQNNAYNTYIRAQPINFQGQNYRHPSSVTGQYYTF